MTPARAFREIGAGVTITPNAMNMLNCLGVGSDLANQDQLPEPPAVFWSI